MLDILLSELKTLVLHYLTENELEHLTRLPTSDDTFIEQARKRYNELLQTVGSLRLPEELTADVPNAAPQRQARIRVLKPLIEQCMGIQVDDKTQTDEIKLNALIPELKKIRTEGKLATLETKQLELKTRYLQMFCIVSPILSQYVFTVATQQLREHLAARYPQNATAAADTKKEVFSATDDETIFKRNFIQRLFSLGATMPADFLASDDKSDDIQLTVRAVINRTIENDHKDWNRGILFNNFRAIKADPDFNAKTHSFILLFHHYFQGYPQTQDRVSATHQEYLKELTTIQTELDNSLKQLSSNQRWRVSSILFGILFNELPLQLQLKLGILIAANKNHMVANVIENLRGFINTELGNKYREQQAILKHVNAFLDRDEKTRAPDMKLDALVSSYRKLTKDREILMCATIKRLQATHQRVQQSCKPRLLKEHDWRITRKVRKTDSLVRTFAEQASLPMAALTVFLFAAFMMAKSEKGGISNIIATLLAFVAFLFIIRPGRFIRLPGGSMSMLELAEYDQNLYHDTILCYPGGATFIEVASVTQAIDWVQAERVIDSKNLNRLESRLVVVPSNSNVDVVAERATAAAADSKASSNAATATTRDKHSLSQLREMREQALRRRSAASSGASGSSLAAANTNAASASNVTAPNSESGGSSTSAEGSVRLHR